MKDCCDNCKHGETCCDDEKASGKLYARRGERSAARYYPLRTEGGDLVIAAAQGMENEREIFQLGVPYAAEGDGVFFESYQAAKKSLYNRLKADGDPKPGRAFGVFVTHVDPRGLTVARRTRAARGVQVVPSGLSSARAEGELAGDREVERLVASLSSKYGFDYAGDPGVRVLVRKAIEDASIKAAERRYRDRASINAFIDGYRSKAEARAFRTRSSRGVQVVPSYGVQVVPSGSAVRNTGIALAGIGAAGLVTAGVMHFYLRDRIAGMAEAIGRPIR